MLACGREHSDLNHDKNDDDDDDDDTMNLMLVGVDFAM